MKNLNSILMKLVSVAMLMILSTTTHAEPFPTGRYPQVSEDPNASSEISQPTSQSGTMPIGSHPPESQNPVCPTCQTAGGATLANSKGTCVTAGCDREIHARPAQTSPSPAGSSR